VSITVDALWEFDDNFDDANGNTYPMAVAGSPSFSTVTKKLGSHALTVAGSFGNGHGAYSDIDATLGSIAGGKTWAFWCNIQGSGNWIYVGVGTDEAVRYRVVINRGASTSFYIDTQAGQLANVFRPNTANWWHVAIIQSADGATTKFYLNGVFVQNLSAPFVDYSLYTNPKIWVSTNNCFIDQMFVGPYMSTEALLFVYKQGDGREFADWADYENIVPATPTAVVAGKQIGLNLADNGGNGNAVTQYKIYRGTASGSLTYFETVSRTASSQLYTDSTGTLGQTYYYRVAAVNSIGESSQSAEVSAVRANLPAVISDISYTWVGDLLTISWDAPYDGGSAIDGYGISIWNDAEGFDGRGWDGTAPETTEYTFDLSLFGPDGDYEEYSVNVEAYNGAGASIGSEVVVLKFPPPTPYRPDSVSESRSRSCETNFTNSLGRQSIAVDQPPSGGDNYPFVGASDIDKLLGDAYLSYFDPTCEFVRPFRIRWLYGFGCLKAFVASEIVHDYDALIEDANGAVVFDSREATSFTASLWGNRLRVLQWLNTETDSVLRLVQHIAWNPDEDPQNWPIYLEPINGQLDERVSERLLPRLRSLRVDLGEPQQGSVRLLNGFNTTIEKLEIAAADGERLTTSLVISAAPGLGKGKFGPACDEAATDTPGILRRINNVQGDVSGNFLLDATGCYRIERPVLGIIAEIDQIRHVQVRDHTLQVSNDCGPCCDCEDFLNTYEGIRRLRDRYAALFDRAKAVRDLYIKNRARVIESADCRKNDPLRIVVRPMCPDEVAVAIGFCNNTDECLRNLVVPINFEFEGTSSFSECDADTEYTGGYAPAVACNSTFRSGNREESPVNGNSGGDMDYYQLGGTYPHFYAAWERVDPGGLAQVTFRIKFPVSQAGDQVEISVDAYSASGTTGVPLSGSGTYFPIAGYEPGRGPVTPEALAARLVDACKIARTALLQEECCAEDGYSEV